MRTLLLLAMVLPFACSGRDGGDESLIPDGASGAAGSSTGGSSGSAGSAGVAGSAGSDASAGSGGTSATCPAEEGYETQAVAIPTCDGLGPGTEDCHFRLIRKKDTCCAEKPCDRLVVYFAGGNQTCDDGDLDPLVQAYADRGFVAACAQPFTTEAEGGEHPYFQEVERMSHVVESVRSAAAGTWTGEKLALGGTSHGGTAPLVVIAAGKLLETRADVWTGSTHTALLLYDGISNPKTLEEWTGAQPTGSSCGLFHQRFVGRYGDGAPLAHDCGNGACYCANPAHAADWAKDTVLLGSTEPPTPYTCADFLPAGKNVIYRFASCSGAPGSTACGLLGDIIPDDQQSLAHDALATCSGAVTSYAKYAECSHVLCGGFGSGTNCGGEDGVTWLEANGW
jgi:hypothetical protein